MKTKRLKVEDISKPDEQLAVLDPKDFMPLPYPYHEDGVRPIKQLTDAQRDKYECSLDGIVAAGILKPESKEEEERRVKAFLEGLKKLLTADEGTSSCSPQ